MKGNALISHAAVRLIRAAIIAARGAKKLKIRPTAIADTTIAAPRHKRLRILDCIRRVVMQGIKEEFDADRKENYVSITDFITEQNK